jgi:hypothetical protein
MVRAWCILLTRSEEGFSNRPSSCVPKNKPCIMSGKLASMLKRLTCIESKIRTANLWPSPVACVVVRRPGSSESDTGPSSVDKRSRNSSIFEVTSVHFASRVCDCDLSARSMFSPYRDSSACPMIAYDDLFLCVSLSEPRKNHESRRGIPHCPHIHVAHVLVVVSDQLILICGDRMRHHTRSPLRYIHDPTRKISMWPVKQKRGVNLPLVFQHPIPQAQSERSILY